MTLSIILIAAAIIAFVTQRFIVYKTASQHPGLGALAD